MNFTCHLIFSSADLGRCPNGFGTDHLQMPKLVSLGHADILPNSVT